MAQPKRTARQEIERAFHVSFKLPEQAAELLDRYAAEVRDATFTEAEAIARNTPAPPEAGQHRHWFQFATNRSADRIRNKHQEKP